MKTNYSNFPGHLPSESCRENFTGDKTEREIIKMGALSEADHNWFIGRMEEGASTEQLELVEEDLGHLKQLYVSYRNGIKQLHQIAENYETTRRNIQVKLRLQQKAVRQGSL